MSSAVAISQPSPLPPPLPMTRIGKRRAGGAHVFPELEPAGKIRREPRIRFISRSAQSEPTRFTARRERGDLIAQLTVYVMTLTVMVLAFPIGFGLLIFNILGGENFRTTAHVMALTGMALALFGAGGILPLF